MRKKVEFDAHKKVKEPTKVKFTTRDGDRVSFVAAKPVNIPVHVRFTVDSRKRG